MATNNSNGQKGSFSRKGLGDGQSSTPNEETSLLAVPQHNGYDTAERSDDELTDSDIEANDFDTLLARSDSYNPQLGIEPGSQENTMLRGPRKYRRPSKASSHSGHKRRKSSTSNEHENADEDEEEGKEQSPFLGGVSVTRFWFIFGGVLIMYFVGCFDSTIMVSSHPIITSYFHSSNSASWLSTAFLLTATAFQSLFGRLSDTIGRRKPYIFCTAIFFGATVWCGAAQSMISFIWARALCGLGAGGMMTMGSIIVSDLVPIEVRGTYQSYINILFGVGSTMGAAFGGAIADSLGWRWEFYIQLPAIGICLLAAILTIPRDLGLTKGAQQKSVVEAMKVFDYKGSILLTSSITFLILGLNLGGNVYPWSHPFVITSLVIFSICFPLFIWVESFVELPIMPLKLLTSNPRASILFSNALAAVLANAAMFNIPLFFQAVLLESATESGLRLMVPSIAGSVFGTFTGFWITYSKMLKAPMLSGAIMCTVGAAGLTCLRKDMPNYAYILLLIPTNIGTGLLFPSAFISILAVSEQVEQAVVTSTLVLWRAIGVVLGVASSSLVLQNALKGYLEEMVVGPDKEDVIEQVRKSVTAIAKLKQPYREQVVDAYAASLRVTFLLSAIIGVVVIAIVAPLRLPRLGHRK